MNDKTVGSGAGLTNVSKFREHCAVYRGIEVSIFEDKERRIATKFHRGAKHLIGGLLEKLAPNLS